MFNDINQELVDKGMAAHAEKGIKAHGYVCDVTDEPAVQAMVATIEKVGTIDILVNNAGIIRRVPITKWKLLISRRVIDIDLNAPFIVSKAVLPAMMKSVPVKSSTSSMMSELGRETVSRLRCQRVVWRCWLAISVLNMVNTTFSVTASARVISLLRKLPSSWETSRRKPSPVRFIHLRQDSCGRWLDPEELTGPAVFLASEASNAVNGHVLYVDGGILAYIGKQPK